MFNYDVVVKLKDALASVYWFKRDMINLINTHTSEWIGFHRQHTYTKKELSTMVLNRLWREERYDEITNLVQQVLVVSDFSHFDGIENGDTYKERAIKYQNALNESWKKRLIKEN